MPDHSPSYIYDVLLVIWRLVINIFFREIRPRGAYNIPKSGPVILVAAPHANQFLDSFILMSEVHRETHRRVEAVIAAKSMKRKIIGTFARWMSAIPVARAADDARLGSGLIVLSDDDSCTILGHGTRFKSELKPKSQIMLPKSLGTLTAEVVEIVSDSEVKIRKEFGDEIEEGTLQVREAIAEAKANGIPGLNFKCVPHIDQQEVYRFVYERLKNGACIGIFPEGGSHDRTDLLPLKAGVTLMALGAMANDASIDVKIVPVGLSYFHAHKFRSRAVIEFGSPMDVPQEMVELYKEGGVPKRQACSRLLDLVYEGLKTVTLRAPDYETLMLIQAARRLYQIPGQHLTLSQVVQLNKRFLQAYLHFKDDLRVEHLKRNVLKYNRALRDLGLRDHQVPGAKPASWKVLGLLTHRSGLLIFWSALALPGVVLNGPIFILVSIISRRKAEEALAESTVKVAGRDVIGSWKVIISLIAVPILYSIYAILVLSVAIQANLPPRWRILTPILTLFSLPIMSYAALKFGETGTDILKPWRSLRPLVIALFPGQHRRLNEIKRTRKTLSNELTSLVNELAPILWEDFDKNTVLIPSASTLSAGNSGLWSRNPQRGALLTHPMAWLDDRLFGWDSSTTRSRENRSIHNRETCEPGGRDESDESNSTGDYEYILLNQR
ncbi:SCT1_1 [Sanghuangporus sanghuang]